MDLDADYTESAASGKRKGRAGTTASASKPAPEQKAAPRRFSAQKSDAQQATGEEEPTHTLPLGMKAVEAVASALEAWQPEHQPSPDDPTLRARLLDGMLASQLGSFSRRFGSWTAQAQQKAAAVRQQLRGLREQMPKEDKGQWCTAGVLAVARPVDLMHQAT